MIDDGGAVGMRGGGPRSGVVSAQRQPIRRNNAGRTHLQDPAALAGQPQLLALQRHHAVVDREPEPLPRLGRVAEDDHRSSQIVVPSRSNTRRPSSSHFALPASP